ncbi:DUF4140 domain-containing protein [Zooshikella marina]|uniref:DUF4139 domain-containing protein n=1 Tax=Zooshikella ganghwensis TaxID=202772 RepID=UPI001BAFC74B|nr:DUF4139 domain-containing protein [Zooshikella ganghwensis]MBU2706692.1 DUF4140 domain-containing protein [Zooshikella ganghwensis]
MQLSNFLLPEWLPEKAVLNKGLTVVHKLKPLVCISSVLVMSPVSVADTLSLNAAEDAEHTALTLYPNAALVEQGFNKPIKPGVQTIVLQNISDQVLLDSLTIQGQGYVKSVQLTRQPLTYDQLMKSVIGKSVSVYQSGNYLSSSRQGTLLAYENKLGIVSVADGEHLLVDLRDQNGLRIALPKATLPKANFTPQLMAQWQGKENTEQAKVRYLTTGLSYSNHYAIAIEPEQKKLNITVNTILANKTRTQFNQAEVTLAAGDLGMPAYSPKFKERARMEMAMAPDAVGAAPPEALGELNFYHFKEAFAIPAHSEQQLTLLSEQGIAYQRHYEHAFYSSPFSRQMSSEHERPVTLYEFTTESDLPSGEVRVFQQDSRGRSQWIGQSSLADTGAGQKVKLRLGESFDIDIMRKKQDVKQIDKNTLQIDWQVEIQNSKTEEVSLVLADQDASLLSLSLLEGAEIIGHNRMQVKLPAKQKTTVTYRSTHRR